MSSYWTIGQNPEGRDFVVGDVHGHLKQLQAQLDSLAFDPGRDRLFCLGDIVDRGPDSSLMLDMIDQQVYFSILGNHEAMMIAGLEDPADMPLHFANGGEWFYELPRSEQRRLVDKVRQWPWAMEIDTGIKRVGLVHADVPERSWSLVRQLLRGIDEYWQDGAALSDAAVAEVAKKILWNRNLITRVYRDVVGLERITMTLTDYRRAFRDCAAQFQTISARQTSPFHVRDIDAVFMGHSYVPQATTVGNCHFLDTFRGEGDDQLSIICINDSAA